MSYLYLGTNYITQHFKLLSQVVVLISYLDSESWESWELIIILILLYICKLYFLKYILDFQIKINNIKPSSPERC